MRSHDAKPVDYPDYAQAVGEAVRAGCVERGILARGGGVGASIASNKLPACGLQERLNHFWRVESAVSLDVLYALSAALLAGGCFVWLRAGGMHVLLSGRRFVYALATLVNLWVLLGAAQVGGGSARVIWLTHDGLTVPRRKSAFFARGRDSTDRVDRLKHSGRDCRLRRDDERRDAEQITDRAVIRAKIRRLLESSSEPAPECSGELLAELATSA